VYGAGLYLKTDFPSLGVYGCTRWPTLRLITCGGEFDRRTGQCPGNVVVFAEYVGQRRSTGRGARTRRLLLVRSPYDPRVVIIGGSWGRHPVVMEAISAAFARLPRRVPVRAAGLTDQPSLAGARSDAVGGLRSAIVATAHPPRQA
jgi:hypothetical protein